MVHYIDQPFFREGFSKEARLLPHLVGFRTSRHVNGSSRWRQADFDIRLQLHREGYNHELIQGPALFKQLCEVMEQAR